LNETEKQAYQAEAAYQNDCRKELEQIPLQTKQEKIQGLFFSSGGILGSVEHLQQVSGKCCSKVSAKRLKVNLENNAKHPYWDSFNFGLGNASGALRKEYIDATSPLIDLAHELQAGMHCPDPDPDAHVKPLPSNICSDIYGHGHCRQCPGIQLAHRFTKQFGKELHFRNISSGSLLAMKPCKDDDGFRLEYYFLGALLKKPIRQVLVRAYHIDGAKYTLLSQTGMPYFAFSIDVFQRWLSDGNDFSVIDVTKMQFELDISMPNSLCSVSSVKEDVTFQINAHQKRKTRTKIKTKNLILPFGIQLPKPVRRRKSNKANQRNKDDSENLKSHSASDQDQVLDLSDSSSKSSSSYSYSHSSSGSSLSSSSNSDSQGTEDSEIDLSEETEVVLPPCAVPAVAEEISSIDAALADVVRDRNVRADLAAEYTSSKKVFTQHIGFSGCGVASTSGSRCYHCEQIIPKGSSRFSYYWNVKRPSRWLHDSCVLRFLSSGSIEGQLVKKAQAVAHFDEMVSQFSHTVTDQQLRASVVSILNQLKLQSNSGSSSSSSSFAREKTM
jgi:hypothetical protein